MTTANTSEVSVTLAGCSTCHARADGWLTPNPTKVPAGELETLLTHLSEMCPGARIGHQ